MTTTPTGGKADTTSQAWLKGPALIAPPLGPVALTTAALTDPNGAAGAEAEEEVTGDMVGAIKAKEQDTKAVAQQLEVEDEVGGIIMVTAAGGEGMAIVGTKDTGPHPEILLNYLSIGLYIYVQSCSLFYVLNHYAVHSNFLMIHLDFLTFDLN